MAQIDKIQVGSTTYDIAPSAGATNTFTSGDVADGSATSWTTVAALASGETTSSILGKVSNMFKNIRYLYKQMGTTDISGVGTDIKAAISALSSGKSDSGHTHTASDLKDGNGNSLIVTSQTADNNHVPSALLVKNMNDVLTSLNNVCTDFTGATSATAGIHGLVPAPASGAQAKFLRGDATWQTPTNTTYTTYTSAANGLVPAAKSGTTSYLTSAYVLTGAGWKAGTKYNTDTTYATFTSAANGMVPAAKSGTTSIATTGYVLTGAGWAAGTKYNTDTIATYEDMIGATTAVAGTSGLVPAPAAGDPSRVLRANGTWSIIDDDVAISSLWSALRTTYATWTAGVVPKPTEAQATTNYVLTGAGWAAGTKYNTDTTYATATTSAQGLLGATEKVYLNNLRGLRGGTSTDVWYASGAGFHCYYYEGDGTTYNAPVDNCIIMVAVRSANRGVAICIDWKANNYAQIWTNRMHNDSQGWSWSGWVRRGHRYSYSSGTLNIYDT